MTKSELVGLFWGVCFAASLLGPAVYYDLHPAFTWVLGGAMSIIFTAGIELTSDRSLAFIPSRILGTLVLAAVLGPILLGAVLLQAIDHGDL